MESDDSEADTVTNPQLVVVLAAHAGRQLVRRHVTANERSRKRQRHALAMLFENVSFIEGRLANQHRDRSQGLQLVWDSPPDLFRRMFRLSKEVFFGLLDKASLVHTQ